MTKTLTVLVAALLLTSACGARPTNQLANTATTSNVSWPALDRWSKTGEAPKDIAVIVSIEDYAFLPDVAGASANAADWEAWFASRGMKQVYVLNNQNAASEEMLRLADMVADAAEEESQVWYVFIGHGAPATDGTDGVLIGMDARQTPDSITARGVRQQELIARLERGRQASTVVVVDACFSGQTANGQALAKGTQPVIALTAPPNVGSQTVVLSAAKSDQFAGALPTAERPAFSYLLLGALRGWADEGDGRLSAADAHQFVLQQLRHVVGRTQTPVLAGAGDLLLTSHANEPDPDIASKMRGTVETEVKPAREGVQLDTGAGVVLTPRPDWAPDTIMSGALAAYDKVGPNVRQWMLWGYRDPNGEAEQWITDFHNEYRQLEDQNRPTQVVKYNGVSMYETAYLANIAGNEVSIFIWDIPRPGAFYRALAIIYNSDHNLAGDYAELQDWMTRLDFTSAANAPRLSDEKPFVFGKMSKATLE